MLLVCHLFKLKQFAGIIPEPNRILNLAGQLFKGRNRRPGCLMLTKNLRGNNIEILQPLILQLRQQRGCAKS